MGQGMPKDGDGWTLVSTVSDTHGNTVDRYEGLNADGMPGVRLEITLSDRTTRKKGEVIDWYWRHVGTFEPLSVGWRLAADA